MAGFDNTQVVAAERRSCEGLCTKTCCERFLSCSFSVDGGVCGYPNMDWLQSPREVARWTSHRMPILCCRKMISHSKIVFMYTHIKFCAKTLSYILISFFGIWPIDAYSISQLNDPEWSFCKMLAWFGFWNTDFVHVMKNPWWVRFSFSLPPLGRCQFEGSKRSIRSQLSLSRIPTKDLNNLAEDVETVRQNEGVLVRMAMHPWFERITMAVIFLNAIWKLGAKRRLELPNRGLKSTKVVK